MVKYCCERCGYTTTFKTHYNKHINRKNPCKSILNNTSIEELRENFKNNNITPNYKIVKKVHKCEVCCKIFDTEEELNYHKQTCNISNKLKLIKKLEEENEILKKTKVIHQTTNNIINNTSNVTNNNTLILNNFGSENWNYMGIDKLKNYLLPPIPAITKVNQQIYCNDEHPENHNMKISSLYGNYMQVFENNKWVHKLKSDVLENIVDKTYNKLDNCYEEVHKEIFNNKETKRFKNFQHEYQNNEKFKKDICDKTGMMIFNFSKKKDLLI